MLGNGLMQAIVVYRSIVVREYLPNFSSQRVSVAVYQGILRLYLSNTATNVQY